MQFQTVRTPVMYSMILSISLAVFLIYLVSISHYLTDHDENSCDMTYMFEYPQYVRIGLSSKNDDTSEDYLYPRFRLYAYGEGFVTERLRRMHFTGIPVLFIPGNAGSHEQVRSLASVSLRKSLKHRTPFHFDYFSISFRKDYSALYGSILHEQTNYVAKCIQKIISLYQGKVKNIILIGHSMGGIIAKGALLLAPDINSNVASILITLATPHKILIYPDLTFLNYFQELTKSMIYLKENGTTVISISGGPRDILVPSAQSIDDYADLNVLTTNIPGVWRSTDHLAILWCKQLILNIIRSLFDCVDTSQKPPAIFKNHEQRMKSFNWHLLERFTFKKELPRTPYPEKFEFRNEESEWTEDIRRQYVWSSKNYTEQNKLKKPIIVYHMIRVNVPIDTLTVEAIRLKNKDWIFACSASTIQGQSRVCTWGWNLSNQTRIVPGLTRKPWKYTIDLDLNKIRTLGVSHVLIKVPVYPNSNGDNNKVAVDDDDDDEDENNQIVRVDMYSRASRFKKMSSMKSLTPELGNIRYHVILDDITDVVSVEMKSVNCSDNTFAHYAMVELLEPWISGAGQIHFFTESDGNSKTMSLQTVHSQRLRVMKSQHAELRFSLDPACSYNIDVRRGDLIERITCMVRDRWPVIYPVTVGIILIVIGQRIDINSENNTNASHISAITMILCYFLNLTIESFVGIAILHIMAVGVCCAVVFFGSVAHNIAVRFLARAITFSTTWSDWLLGGLVNQLPVVAAGILLSMIPATCGALAMLLSIFLHFLRLTSTYEDYLEELLWATMRHFNLLRRKNSDDEESGDSKRQNIFNQVLLFLFWCFASLPAIPSVLVWAKNFSFSTRLITEDQVYLYSWIVMVGCGTSGLVKISTASVNTYRTKFLATFLRCIGWIVIATSNAPHYFWCLPPCLALVVVLISINTLQT